MILTESDSEHSLGHDDEAIHLDSNPARGIRDGGVQQSWSRR
jgi:hypothetical protein